MRKRLFVTVGLPRAGKSTWCKQQGVPVVCGDAVRLALHGQRFLQEAEPMVWVIAKVMVKALFEAGHSTVIVDETGVTHERQNQWLSDKWETTFVLFDTYKSVCIERALKTFPDLVPIIEKMSAEWEQPDHYVYPDEVKI